MTPGENLDRQWQVIRKNLEKSLRHLETSYERCRTIDLSNILEGDLESLEAFSSRFARTMDYLLKRSFRTIDAIELADQGSLIDVLNRAEKRGLIDSVKEFREIRLLRNEIAHEYSYREPELLAKDILRFTPVLIRSIERTRAYEPRQI